MTTYYEALEGPSVLDAKGLRALLASPDKRKRLGKRDGALLAVLCLGGLRAGECATLRVSDLEDGGQGVVRLRFRTAKRRNHFRAVSLPPLGGKAVRAWLQARDGRGSPWLFPGAKGKAICVRAVEKRVGLYLTAIGRTDLHLHSLRHSALSTLMRETGDLYRVQRMAGHASPTTTAAFYLAWSVTEADQNAEAMAAALSVRRGKNGSERRSAPDVALTPAIRAGIKHSHAGASL